VYSTDGIVACTQPLACEAGLKILREGGNAAVSSVQHSPYSLQLRLLSIRLRMRPLLLVSSSRRKAVATAIQKLITGCVAAMLNLTEPASTGIGGDMFCLYYNAETRKVRALNGSGRAGSFAKVDRVRRELEIPDGESGTIPLTSIHVVTVPGAAAGWVDTVEKFGSRKLSLEQILAPATDLADRGFPVSEVSSILV
jgi:gamma-glutamyltranspeptidase / glutathione hydrolase